MLTDIFKDEKFLSKCYEIGIERVKKEKRKRIEREELFMSIFYKEIERIKSNHNNLKGDVESAKLS